MRPNTFKALPSKRITPADVTLVGRFELPSEDTTVHPCPGHRLRRLDSPLFFRWNQCDMEKKRAGLRPAPTVQVVAAMSSSPQPGADEDIGATANCQFVILRSPDSIHRDDEGSRQLLQEQTAEILRYAQDDKSRRSLPASGQAPTAATARIRW